MDVMQLLDLNNDEIRHILSYTTCEDLNNIVNVNFRRLLLLALDEAELRHKNGETCFDEYRYNNLDTISSYMRNNRLQAAYMLGHYGDFDVHFFTQIVDGDMGDVLELVYMLYPQYILDRKINGTMFYNSIALDKSWSVIRTMAYTKNIVINDFANIINGNGWNNSKKQIIDLTPLIVDKIKIAKFLNIDYVPEQTQLEQLIIMFAEDDVDNVFDYLRRFTIEDRHTRLQLMIEAVNNASFSILEQIGYFGFDINDRFDGSDGDGDVLLKAVENDDTTLVKDLINFAGVKVIDGSSIEIAQKEHNRALIDFLLKNL